MYEIYALNPTQFNAELAYRRARITDAWPRRSGPRVRRWRRTAARTA